MLLVEQFRDAPMGRIMLWKMLGDEVIQGPCGSGGSMEGVMVVETKASLPRVKLFRYVIPVFVSS